MGTELMTFGEAIEAIKNGNRVTRIGWNGKGMYLTLCTHSYGIKARLAEGEALLPIVPSIVMRTAQETLVVGWVASQTDMLSEDWILA